MPEEAEELVLDDAADSLSSLDDLEGFLDGEGDQAQEPSEDLSAESSEVDAEDDGEATEAKANAEAEPEDDDTDEGASVFEVDLPDGTTKEVTLTELHEGWQAAQNPALTEAQEASLRQEAGVQTQEAVKQAVQQTIQSVENNALAWLMANPVGEEPSRDMLDPNSDQYNPDKFHLMNADRNRAANQRQAAVGEVEKLRARQTQEASREEAAYAQAQLVELVKAVPEWSKPEYQKQFMDDVVSLYGEAGVTPELLNGITNKAFYIMAKDAISYKKMQKGTPKAKAKLKAKPKPIRAAAKASKSASAKRKSTQGMSQLRKTGSIEDAVNMLLE